VTEILVVTPAIFAFALVSERSSMSPITAPMVLTTVGSAVGPWARLDDLTWQIALDAVGSLTGAPMAENEPAPEMPTRRNPR